MQNIIDRIFLAFVATMVAVLAVTDVLPAMNVQAADLSQSVFGHKSCSHCG